jgi:CBS domain-containing protein
VLIINKRHEDDEFGMVLLSDIAKKVIAEDRSPERVNVYEVMAKPVISVDPHMDIRYCSRLFENFGLAHAPVIEDDKVLGIVSYRSIVLKGILGD